jgi:small subunit ribosomal protein S3
MGQKINPHGLRVGIIKDWDSRWYANKQTFGDTLVSDYKVREYLKKQLQKAGVPKIEIERMGDKIKINIWAAKPGMVVGQKGDNIARLRTAVEKMTSKSVSLNIVEVKSPDMNAQLVAENIAAQLENRISFRRAMKQAIGRSMKLGAKGIKTRVSGRLGGAEIARAESYHEGTIPLQTIRADIDYGFAEANTSYGKIGVKVWIYKGEVLKGDMSAERLRALQEMSSRPKRERADRGDRGANRRTFGRTEGGQGGQGGFNRGGQGGGFNRGAGQGSQGGGFNRGVGQSHAGQGGYGSRPQGAGQGGQGAGGNRPYISRPQNARPAGAPRPAPATPAPTSTEGGNA